MHVGTSLQSSGMRGNGIPHTFFREVKCARASLLNFEIFTQKIKENLIIILSLINIQFFLIINHSFVADSNVD